MGILQERISNLETYYPDQTKTEDFETYWEDTLALYRQGGQEGTRRLVHTPYDEFVTSYDVSFVSFDGTRIHGWLLVPCGEEPRSGVVTFPGYHGGRGLPQDHIRLAAAGFVVLAIDARGQGGKTGSKQALDTGTVSGWITQGILSPQTSYYRFLFGDAYGAVTWLANQPEVAEQPLGTHGSSQGGGLSLWMGALHRKVQACAAHVPNMCHLERGVWYSTGSLTEIKNFLRRFPEYYDQVMCTISYFDFLNIADKFSIPVLVSVGLQDIVCLPETIFGAYNHIPSTKQILWEPFAAHPVSTKCFSQGLYFLQKHLIRE